MGKPKPPPKKSFPMQKHKIFNVSAINKKGM